MFENISPFEVQNPGSGIWKNLGSETLLLDMIPQTCNEQEEEDSDIDDDDVSAYEKIRLKNIREREAMFQVSMNRISGHFVIII